MVSRPTDSRAANILATPQRIPKPMNIIRSLFGLAVALFSIPLTVIAYALFIVGAAVFALANVVAGFGAWIAK